VQRVVEDLSLRVSWDSLILDVEVVQGLILIRPMELVDILSQDEHASFQTFKFGNKFLSYGYNISKLYRK
jgi:hypothetical protein